MNLQARYAGRLLVGLLSASFLIAPATSNGAELTEETLNAWGAYVQQANSKMDDRLQGTISLGRGSAGPTPTRSYG